MEAKQLQDIESWFREVRQRDGHARLMAGSDPDAVGRFDRAMDALHAAQATASVARATLAERLPGLRDELDDAREEHEKLEGLDQVDAKVLVRQDNLRRSIRRLQRELDDLEAGDQRARDALAAALAEARSASVFPEVLRRHVTDEARSQARFLGAA
jgi:predicted  nucleic acid-binding Zn-ribbon protein